MNINELSPVVGSTHVGKRKGRGHATCNGKTVLTADWGPAVSKNPFLAFRFKGAKAGDKISVTWVDTNGATRTDEATIA